jgi:hypothetical protein
MRNELPPSARSLFREDISQRQQSKKMKITRVATVGAFASLCLAFGPISANATTTIDASHQYSYGANIGSMNWLADSSADGVSIGEFICYGSRGRIRRCLPLYLAAVKQLTSQ